MRTSTPRVMTLGSGPFFPSAGLATATAAGRPSYSPTIEAVVVDCALLTTAFEVFRGGTICEHAALTIDRIPARWECSRCRGEVARGGFLRCPQCNAPARLAAGDEIVLQRIELEVA
mgnify:CR=1 FL=1